MEEELIEGNLQLKYSAKYRQAGNSGWRHYIKDGENDHDIHCSEYMEVGRIEGRYGAGLTEPVEAYLIIGEFHPGSQPAQVTIPLGTLVRVRKNN
ncbi:MAG: hypothetical protein ABSA82_01220 [Thermacetogeniaceae bacterium]|jgi:hypothetical protein